MHSKFSWSSSHIRLRILPIQILPIYYGLHRAENFLTEVRAKPTSFMGGMWR
jgi:hypothetical protein